MGLFTNSLSQMPMPCLAHGWGPPESYYVGSVNRSFLFSHIERDSNIIIEIDGTIKKMNVIQIRHVNGSFVRSK